MRRPLLPTHSNVASSHLKFFIVLLVFCLVGAFQFRTEASREDLDKTEDAVAQIRLKAIRNVASFGELLPRIEDKSIKSEIPVSDEEILKGYKDRRKKALKDEKKYQDDMKELVEKARKEESEEFGWVAKRKKAREEGWQKLEEQIEERKSYKEKADADLQSALEGNAPEGGDDDENADPGDAESSGDNPGANDDNGGDAPSEKSHSSGVSVGRPKPVVMQDTAQKEVTSLRSKDMSLY